MCHPARPLNHDTYQLPASPGFLAGVSATKLPLAVLAEPHFYGTLSLFVALPPAQHNKSVRAIHEGEWVSWACS